MMKSRLRLLGSLLCAATIAVGCSSSSDDGGDGDNGQAGSTGTQAGAPGAGTSGAGNNLAGATTGGASAGSGTVAGSTFGGSANTGGVAGTCDPNEAPVCLDASRIQICTSDGVYMTPTCREEVCDALGFAPGDCTTTSEGGECDCGEPVNTECADGAVAFCVCYDDCADEDLLDLYVTCHVGEPAEFAEMVLCYQSHITTDAAGDAQIDCAAAEQCIPATP